MGWVPPGDEQGMRQRVVDGLGATSDAVVAVAPGRVNLIGEHTDYNRGLCLPVALPHATYAAARGRDDGFRLRSAHSDDVWTGSLDDAARAEGWAAYAAGVLWALREAGFEVPPLDLYVDSSVPLGAGLSSSAALECAVATAALGLTGTNLDDDLRTAVARACVRAETEVAGAPTGGMDQSIALFGRESHALLLDFDSDGRLDVALPLEEVGLAVLVADTRVSHALTDGGYASRRTDCEAAAAALGVHSLRAATAESVERLDHPRVRARARHVVTEIARVEAFVDAVDRAEWETVGALMDESHVSMRDDFEISCPELDLVVETAQSEGALGARMTGGGFGGSAIALLHRDGVDRVAAEITRASAAAGFPEPEFLLARPSRGARLL